MDKPIPQAKLEIMDETVANGQAEVTAASTADAKTDPHNTQAMTTTTSTEEANDSTSPSQLSRRKRKAEHSSPTKLASSNGHDYLDVAADLGLKIGDRIQVYWTIVEEASDEEEPSKKTVKEEVTRLWWTASLVEATGETHDLTEDEVEDSDAATLFSGKRRKKRGVLNMKVPIYKLLYGAMEKFGFSEDSYEEVAFISDQSLLNLSTNEMMFFKKEGAPDPPMKDMEEGLNIEDDIDDEKEDEDLSGRDFESEEDMRNYMDEVIKGSLAKTGVGSQMKTLSPSLQRVLAEKINKAKEQMMEKIMEELNNMDQGQKIVTADMIRRCVAQMGRGL